MVQPNSGIVSLTDRPVHGEAMLKALRDATVAAGHTGAQLVVWPESAFPFLFDRNLPREFAPGHPWALRGDYQGTLLLGSLTHDFRVRDERVYNSAILIGSDGTVRGRYDKNRLLPFGEFIPWADRFPTWAARLHDRMPDSPLLEPGQGPVVLEDGKLRVGALICYEDLFPDLVATTARARPNLLVTVANLAWFGDSATPELAQALATLRAVEARRDLVRATNSGVSSLSDALGRTLARSSSHGLQQGTPELLTGEVRLLELWSVGPYSLAWFPWLCAVTLLLLVSWQLRRRQCDSV